MQDYLNKSISEAEEYLESGIQFCNLEFLEMGKEKFIKLYKLSKGGEMEDTVVEKIVRGCTALCMVNPDESLTYLNEALLFHKDHPVIYNNFGYVYHKKYGDFEKAIDNYNKCFECDPTYKVAYLGIIDIYNSLRHHALELQYCKKGIKHCPESADLWNSYGLAMLKQAKPNILEIQKIFEKADKLAYADMSTRAKINVNLGHLYGSVGKYDKAIEFYLQSIRYDNHHSNALHNILLNVHYFDIIPQTIVKYFGLQDDNYIPQLHTKICQILYPETSKIKSFDSKSSSNTKTRIGFVSADLVQHAVSFFSSVFFTREFQVNFEVYIYSNNYYDQGAISKLVCKEYKCIKGVDTMGVVELIKNDKIDILIDLSGHTSDNRLDVFSTLPAPLNLSYLGYPNNVGIPHIARISDKFTEKFTDNLPTFQLDRLFLCYTPPFDVKPKPKTEKSRRVTFGCFAKLQKINTSCQILWKLILESNTDAILVLKSKYFCDKNVASTWKAKFSPYEARVVLLVATETPKQHLELYNLIDIHLDTFPYSGTTISTESLYMNVPVVTYCPDSTHVERVTGSILTSLGLNKECIAKTKSQYVYKSLQIAKNIQNGVRLQTHNLFMASEITNKQDFIQKFEDAILLNKCV